VQDDRQVNECIEPLLAAMKRDSVVLIHSTVRSATVRDIAGRAAAKGIHVMDASVTRTEMTDDGRSCSPCLAARRR
jgi:3-hydroxyisobutyrate dehydrogenase-like beta-hydroxyacid dehydrogenase